MVINSETYNKLLAQPDIMENKHVSDLRTLLERYPYFQSVRALYLKGLKNADSFRYNHELKITAAHSTDRTVLFDFITSDVFKTTAKIHQEIQVKIDENPIEYQSEEEKVLDIGKPISFNNNEKHSFQEWLKLSTFKPIQRQSSRLKNQQKIIDKFIETSPKIIPIEKYEEVEISIPKIKTDKSLMTETLAKVYLEQKKYEKAIKAYEILSLKYPEKSGFFADQIKRIKELQENNNI